MLVVGVDISYLSSIIKGRVPHTWSLRLVSINEHGRYASTQLVWSGLRSSEPYTPYGCTNVSPKILNFSELILWRPIATESVNLKGNMQVWLFHMKKKDYHCHKDKKKEHEILIGTSKGTSQWWVGNCGKVWWPYIMSRLANVIRQGGSWADC